MAEGTEKDPKEGTDQYRDSLVDDFEKIAYDGLKAGAFRSVEMINGKMVPMEDPSYDTWVKK